MAANTTIGEPLAYGLPGRGKHQGIGLPFTIWRAGPIPVEKGSVIVGMYDVAMHASFTTASEPEAIYEVKVNSSVFNDTPGGRAHAEAVVWWKASHGGIPALSPITPVSNAPGAVVGYSYNGMFLPRPMSVNGIATGGQTVANTGAPWEDPILPAEAPWKPIAAQGLLYGVGLVPEEQGGLLPSTRYNVDWVARAVIRGSMHILGTTIYVVRVA